MTSPPQLDASQVSAGHSSVGHSSVGQGSAGHSSSASSPSRTRLLVSVRNLAEARVALAGGADLIDIKEPERGSLGRSDRRTWNDVTRGLKEQVPLSVALGELRDDNLLSHASHVPPVRYAKVGLSRAAAIGNWRMKWQHIVRQLSPATEPVAVIYADWQRAGTPFPHDILEQAGRLGCRVVLIDTFDKRQGSLFRVLSGYQLQCLVRQIRHAGFRLVLAGSLAADDIPRALQWKPDWIAVRGAACVGGRRGQVSREKVTRLSSRLTTE